jgi:photosystem II stability/assembly factor-like uncharacterized protein
MGGKMTRRLAQGLMVVSSALLLTLILSGNLWAVGKNDLLTRTATAKMDLAGLIYMDLATAGNRVVAVGEMGVITYSDDQGQSWQQSMVPTSVTLTAVYFADAKNGWAVGHEGVVLHSNDGGQNWQLQLDGNQANKLVLEATRNVHAIMEQRIAAEPDDAKRAELELDMEEIGYQLADAEDAIAAGPINPIMDVWFANELEGLIVGAFGMIFRTEDGGNSWTAINTSIDNPDGFHFYGLAETRAALMLVGEGGIMYRSFDQGRSWETLYSPYEGPMFGIGADQGGNEAIAVGLRGKIVVMNENGGSLELVETVVPVALNAAIPRSDGSWFLVGLAGQLLLQNQNDGAFVPLTTRFPGCMSVVETADKHLLLAGLNGLKRLDYSTIK